MRRDSPSQTLVGLVEGLKVASFSEAKWQDCPSQHKGPADVDRARGWTDRPKGNQLSRALQNQEEA